MGRPAGSQPGPGAQSAKAGSRGGRRASPTGRSLHFNAVHGRQPPALAAGGGGGPLPAGFEPGTGVWPADAKEQASASSLSLSREIP